MDMTADSGAALDTHGAGWTASERLAGFVAGHQRRWWTRLGLWAGFLNAVRADAGMRAIHEQEYHAYRDRLEGLIADLPRWADAARCRAVPPAMR